MRAHVALSLLAFASLNTGCKKHDTSNADYTRVLNAWHATDPACLWQTDVRFPVQVPTVAAEKTRPYDALVDAGLLTRTTAEKRVLILASKEVTNYDLSPAGRAAWTPDPKNPGFGNFCYGTPHVTSINSVTAPPTEMNGPAVEVGYRTDVSNLPAWAQSAETQTAFPLLALDAKGTRAESTTLVKKDTGWVVAAVLVRRTPVMKNPDGSIVE